MGLLAFEHKEFRLGRPAEEGWPAKEWSVCALCEEPWPCEVVRLHTRIELREKENQQLHVKLHNAMSVTETRIRKLEERLLAEARVWEVEARCGAFEKLTREECLRRSQELRALAREENKDDE